MKIQEPEKVYLNGEIVYLKKSPDWMGGHYRVVHPVRNEDGSLNWFNILTGGSWFNLIVTVVIVVMILGVVYDYNRTVNFFLSCFDDPVNLDRCLNTFGYGGAS